MVLERRLDLKLGFACNNHCVFCAQGDRRAECPSRPIETLLEELVAARPEATGLVLTGGEPTVNKNIRKLVRAARKLGYRSVQIQTNGRALSNLRLLQALVAAGLTEVAPSLHGKNAEMHDGLTRAPGSFDQTTRGIVAAVSAGLPVITNSVITKQNFRELPEIVSLLADLGVRKAQLAFVHPVGTAASTFDSVVPRLPDVVEPIRAAREVARTRNMSLMTEAVPLCFLRGMEDLAVEARIPQTVVADLDGRIDHSEWRVREGKAHGWPCLTCTARARCEGPWREYPEHLGWSEFSPIAPSDAGEPSVEALGDASGTRIWLDAEQRGRAAEFAERGVSAVMRLSSDDPGEIFDTLVEALRLGRNHPVEVVGGGKPWLRLPDRVRADDRLVSEVLCRALDHATLRGDHALRRHIDQRAAYRRLIDGVPADADDRLGLRYDLTHAPSPGTATMTLIPTRSCQLRCSYCTVRLADEDSTRGRVERAVDLLFGARGDSVRLQFYGGEPLLRDDLVRLGVERARRLERDSGKTLSVVLTSNGIRVTRELASWAREHDVEVLLSLDGPPELTNAMRLPAEPQIATSSDSYRAAARALGLLLEERVRHQVLVTVTPARASQCAESVEHALSLGARAIQVCYVMGVRWGAEQTAVLADQFEHIIEKHSAALTRGSWSFVNRWRKEPVLLDTALHVDTDGRIGFINEFVFEHDQTTRSYEIARIEHDLDLTRLGASPFHNLYFLLQRYADENPRIGKIIMDNIGLGNALAERMSRIGARQAAVEK